MSPHSLTPGPVRSPARSTRGVRLLVLMSAFALLITIVSSRAGRADADDHPLPAFPGAEGFGMASTGGRGGEVYHITSRELTGPGTFHDALTTAGPIPRTIVFDIGGELRIPQIIVRDKSKITIAGQTAPGDGVTIAGNNVRFYDSSDIVLRYLRFRMTDGISDDTMYFEDCQDVIVDHSSFSWGGDEVLSVKSKDYDNPRSKNITVQWSIISEGLLTHSMGGLVEMNTISLHHDLYADNNDRNPKTKGPMDFVNNVVSNWGDYAYVAGGESGTKGYGNVVGNYFIAGANSTEPQYGVVRGNENYQVYLDDNRLDSNVNSVLDGVDPGPRIMEADRPCVVVDQRFGYPPVHTESPEKAYQHVLEHAGASLVRDAVDRRVTAGVRYQTGVIIDKESDQGGFPQLDPGTARSDTDRDGMPDRWEVAHGLNPKEAADRNGDTDGDGYSDLEEYLNELAAPGFPSGYPMHPVDWDGTPFDPPGTSPETPEPLPPLNGEVARSVTINDSSSTGATNEPLWSVRPNLQVGDTTTGDRDYRFTEIPDDLAGAEWIRPATASRSATDEDLVTFHVARDAEVFIAYDTRISTPPQWLTSGYQDTGAVVTDDQPISYKIFKKAVTAGTRLTLGPNAGGKIMNYFVILRPTAPSGAPDAPTGSKVTGADGTATVQWEPVAGATGYVVYRSSIADPYRRSVATTSDTTFGDHDLTAGMPYRYSIAAVGPGGESAASDPVQVVYYDDGRQPPAAAAAPAVVAHSYSVELSWQGVPDAVAYTVQRADEDGDFQDIGASTEPSLTDSSAEPDTMYRYRLIVLGAGGESIPSDSVAATTGRPLAMPTPPPTPVVDEIGHSSVDLHWQPVTDAADYRIQRKADADSGYQDIGSSTTTAYVDDTVSAAATGYSYRVVATNERGDSVPSAPVHVDTPRPGTPTGVLVGLSGETFVGLIFKPGPGAADHAVYRSQDGEPAEKIGTAKVSTFYDRSTEPGQKYDYTIRAVNAAGESDPSASLTVRTYAAGVGDHAGPWDAGMSYHSGDLVRDADRTWVADRDVTGTKPGQPRGAWMEAGEFVNGNLGPRRAWTSSWTYERGEIVAYRESWWQARRHTRDHAPTAGHGAWRKVS